MRRDTNVEPLFSSNQVSGIKALDIDNSRPETGAKIEFSRIRPPNYRRRQVQLDSACAHVKRNHLPLAEYPSIFSNTNLAGFVKSRSPQWVMNVAFAVSVARPLTLQDSP